VDAAARTRYIQLGVLAVVLVGVVQFVLLPSIWPSGSASSERPARQARPAGRPNARGAAVATEEAPNVRLEALTRGAAVEAPEGARRNPFRLGAATPAPPVPGTEGTIAKATPRPVTPVVPMPTTPVVPPPPPVPPIPYRFIGVVSGAPGVGRIAVLTDGKTVVHGRVNEQIEGRYRIVQIGEESIQIEHADGRGRQTLRLLGQ
jgi:hypothetical protein